MYDTTATFETMSPRARWGLALFCIAVGTYPILLAAGIVEPEPGQLHAPRWVVGTAGGLFVILGLYLPFPHTKARSHALGAVICLGFSAMGGWVALFAEPGSISGGIPFLPQSINHDIGRVVFGSGALLALAMGVHALRCAYRARHDAGR